MLRSAYALSSADSYFGHNTADGSSFWQRIERYYSSSRYRYWSVGANLLWSAESLDATVVVDAALYNSDAPGVFGSDPATIVATDSASAASYASVPRP